MSTFTIKKDLVSIITPCYNGTSLIHRLLDSVLVQDYPSIQMIVVDDGSTDNSKNIILSYKSKFEEKGYSFAYIYQKNAGQAAAINNALKHVEGEYLCWPDCDDYYHDKSAISKMVNEFNVLGEQYGLVRTIGRFVDETTNKKVYKDIKWNMAENLFEPCLFGNGFLIVPINYMARMAAVDDTIPERKIYTGKHPQNLQIFEPILYSYKCKTINESLCTIIVRQNSDSHQKKNIHQQLEDIRGYLEIHLQTVKRIIKIPGSKRASYIYKLKTISYNKQLSLCLRYSNKDEAKNVIELMNRNNIPIHAKKRLMYIILCLNQKFYTLLLNIKK